MGASAKGILLMANWGEVPLCSSGAERRFLFTLECYRFFFLERTRAELLTCFLSSDSARDAPSWALSLDPVSSCWGQGEGSLSWDRVGSNGRPARQAGGPTPWLDSWADPKEKALEDSTA